MTDTKEFLRKLSNLKDTIQKITIQGTLDPKEVDLSNAKPIVDTVVNSPTKRKEIAQTPGKNNKKHKNSISNQFVNFLSEQKVRNFSTYVKIRKYFNLWRKKLGRLVLLKKKTFQVAEDNTEDISKYIKNDISRDCHSSLIKNVSFSNVAESPHYIKTTRKKYRPEDFLTEEEDCTVDRVGESSVEDLYRVNTVKLPSIESESEASLQIPRDIIQKSIPANLYSVDNRILSNQAIINQLNISESDIDLSLIPMYNLNIFQRSDKRISSNSTNNNPCGYYTNNQNSENIPRILTYSHLEYHTSPVQLYSSVGVQSTMTDVFDSKSQIYPSNVTNNIKNNLKSNVKTHSDAYLIRNNSLQSRNPEYFYDDKVDESRKVLVNYHTSNTESQHHSNNLHSNLDQAKVISSGSYNNNERTNIVTSKSPQFQTESTIANNQENRYEMSDPFDDEPEVIKRAREIVRSGKSSGSNRSDNLNTFNNKSSNRHKFVSDINTKANLSDIEFNDTNHSSTGSKKSQNIDILDISDIENGPNKTDVIISNAKMIINSSSGSTDRFNKLVSKANQLIGQSLQNNDEYSDLHKSKENNSYLSSKGKDSYSDKPSKILKNGNSFSSRSSGAKSNSYQKQNSLDQSVSNEAVSNNHNFNFDDDERISLD